MIQRVRIARLSTDVYASSKVKPSALSSFPAACASSLPFSERSTSFQPVKRFSLFHSLSPWRIKTSLCMGSILDFKSEISNLRQENQFSADAPDFPSQIKGAVTTTK